MNDYGIMEIFFQDVKFLCESDDVFKSNLVYLQSKGVMNTPAYWERNVNTIPHLKELINNMADVLRKESCL